MGVLAPPQPSPSATGGGRVGGYRSQDAEMLFRTKPISEIRKVEVATRKEIDDKSEELRQLVGKRYRDLIDSADYIMQMKSTCESISGNISDIHHSLVNTLSSSIDSPKSFSSNPDSSRARIYAIACRVKYLVDTPENIWGCLDESMFLEASARYFRAKHVHQKLLGMNKAGGDDRYTMYNSVRSSNVLSNFPLLQHQWQIVESFKAQISQRSRERLLDQGLLGLGIGAYADALAAVAVIDELDPKQVLTLFLDMRKSCITKRLSSCSSNSNANSADVMTVFCEVLKIIQVSVAQVGELFLQALTDLPLFYKTILGSPPASQLFGGIPNPDGEIRLWTSFKDKLESTMVMLDRDFIAKTCSNWLRNCGKEIVNDVDGRCLIDVIGNGKDLASAEKLIRQTVDSKQVLEGSLEWLRSVFGSEIELPWKRTRELVLGDDSDLWNDIFEDAFLQRMKTIIQSGFEELSGTVNIVESVRAIVERPMDAKFDAGGVWFTEPIEKKGGPIHGSKAQVPEENDVLSCLNAYFGSEITRIRDAVDGRCKNVLEDLLCFLESPRAAARLKDLAPYTQNMCYGSMSTILKEIKSELDQLYVGLGNLNEKGGSAAPPSVLVERSLFLGRLLFAFQKHSRHIPVILGSPRSWINETVSGVSLKSPSLSIYSSLAFDTRTLDSPGRKMFDSSKRLTSLAASALFSIEDGSSSQLEDLTRTTQDLCIRAHNLWIQWVADELSPILHASLRKDDAFSATSPLRGWEKIIVKQEQSIEGNSEMEIYLPSVPSIYVTSFLFKACEEIHRVGGHVLDRPIIQNFASRLLDKVVGVYMGFFEESHSSPVTEKGILQILLDLRFAADILSGGDASSNETPRMLKVKVPFRRKQDLQQTKSAIKERLDGLMSQLCQRLDPIDWLTFEPYLWENEKQSYLRHAVLFGLFVQLNRLYTDALKKLPANSESNIMRCSDVSRFKYLPISAPALSSRGAVKSSSASSLDDVTSRSSWKNYMNGELSRSIDIDDNLGLGVAAPLLKSFMQVGSRFGESTFRLGSILTDGQVGRFGDMLPAQAAGLLSSFTAGRTDS